METPFLVGGCVFCSRETEKKTEAMSGTLKKNRHTRSPGGDFWRKSPGTGSWEHFATVAWESCWPHPAHRPQADGSPPHDFKFPGPKKLRDNSRPCARRSSPPCGKLGSRSSPAQLTPHSTHFNALLVTLLAILWSSTKRILGFRAPKH